MTTAPGARDDSGISEGKGGSEGALALNGVTRRFGDFTAVDNVSFEIGPGELLALVGASGSGKTTTLRIAAGYEIPDAGTVTLGGKDITRIPPERRGFGMVFQHYALFPHMASRFDLFTIWITVLLAIGIHVVGKIPKQQAAIVAAIAWLVGALPAILGARSG